MKKKLELLEHNEVAYEKLINCLKEHNLVAIDHATGTGKSFILLKYLYENRNKRILFLSPTYAIIEQLLNKHMSELGIDKGDFRKINAEIYANINKYDTSKLVDNFDIIILDEYHRCGARKWGMGVNKIIDEIKNNHPEKVVIGTTATEIRYLDNEKNMNNILFDGVVASRLTLADAILKGILPPFKYCNYPYLVLNEIEKLKNKISKYYGSKNEFIDKLNDIKEQIENLIIMNDDQKDFLQKAKKILVFSSTIENIKNDKLIVDKLLKDKKYDEYSITYLNTKEEANNILDKFRNRSDDTSKVLYCINLLNEGVHVKGIDAIIMLRSTISPIIYFQQLGRLLSCSKDKKDVYVFDLVHNIRNNKVIYKLYDEVLTRAKELLATDPENKERYQHIIDNFEIISEYSDIYFKLDKIKEVTTREKLIIRKIDDAIDIVKKNDDEIMVIKSIVDIFHYQEYITLKQFNEISTLDIIKPSIFRYSVDEFKCVLDNHENLRDKAKDINSSLYTHITKFYDFNGCLPSILSKNEQERMLASQLLKSYEYMSDKQQNRIGSLVSDNITYIEKISYGVNVSKIDIKKIYKEIEFCIKNKIFVSEKVIIVLQKDKSKLNKKYIELIRKYNDYTIDYLMAGINKEIDTKSDDEKLKKKYGINKNILYSTIFSDLINDYKNEYLNSNNKDEYLKSIADELVDFVTRAKKLPSYEHENEIKLFIKELLFRKKLKNIGYYDTIDILMDKIQKDKRRSDLNQIISFMDKHNGLLPVEDAWSKEEKQLANLYLKYKDILSNEEKNQMKKVSDKYVNYKFEIIRKYIDFCKKKKREPSRFVHDEYETLLVDEYNRVKQDLNNQERDLINDAVNSLDNYKAKKILYWDIMDAKYNKENDYGKSKK